MTMRSEKKEKVQNTDFCVCCGESVPEGEMVCSLCRMKFSSEQTDGSLLYKLWERTKKKIKGIDN